MKSINKISSYCALLLTFIVLLSSVSLSVDFHFCQGKLKSLSFYGKAKNCHEMASQKVSCPHHKSKVPTSCSEVSKDCCSNQTILVQSDIDKQINNNNYLDFTNFIFVVSNADIISMALIMEAEDVVPFANYKPPLLKKDIAVLYAVFLL